MRAIDSLEARALPGTDGVTWFFWSPDSRFLGFFAGGKLQKIEVSGGPAEALCDALAAEGGTWNRDGVIVFAPNQNSGLYRVSAAGGEPTPLTKLDQSRRERSHRWPQFLPDGRHFLYLAQAPNRIYVGSLDSSEVKPLIQTDSKALYASGYLLFMRQQTLMAQPFDSDRAELVGEAFPVAQEVSMNVGLGRATFGVSDNGRRFLVTTRVEDDPSLPITVVLNWTAGLKR